MHSIELQMEQEKHVKLEKVTFKVAGVSHDRCKCLQLVQAGSQFRLFRFLISHCICAGSFVQWERY